MQSWMKYQKCPHESEYYLFIGRLFQLERKFELLSAHNLVKINNNNNKKNPY